MDINLEKKEIPICNIELVTGEQTFESDILLPDYYQDIMKILKCSALPVITKTNLLSDKVAVDGVLWIKVYYQTTENEIRTMTTKLNFSKVLEIKNGSEDLYVCPKVKLDYINCRAINERKIDVKGAISLSLKLFYNLKEEIISEVSGQGLQGKKDNIETMLLLGSSNNQYNVKEEIQLESGKPDISSIVRYEIDMVCKEKNVIDNKIILKGDIKAKVVYIPFSDNKDDIAPVAVNFILPFNHIVDLAGIETGDDCCLSCDLIWAEITPKSNSDGQNRSFIADLSFNIGVKCYKKITTNFISDSYSTLRNIEIIDKKINCYNVSDKIEETVLVEANISVPDAKKIKIIDVWQIPKITFTKISDGNLTIEGKTELSILAQEGKIPIYIEKFIDFQTQVPVSSIANDDVKFDVEVEAKSLSYDINDDNIDLKIELKLDGHIYQNKVKNIITDIKIDEEGKPKEKTDTNSLIVYYADPGEDVWELAKKYNTNISALMEENENIENGVITEKRMILIPIVN